MEPLLLIVGGHDPAPLRSVLDQPVTVIISDRPERAELDSALDQVNTARLVVAADDAGVAAVIRRLLQRSRLATLELALLPVPGPGLLRARLGLPAGLSDAAAVALGGHAVAQGLVRDDHGGVALGRARLLPDSGTTLGMRTFVDEHELIDGQAASLTVTPQAAGLSASVEVPRWLRRGTARRHRGGRAVTANCTQARLVSDEVERGSLQTHCTWWFEPACWQVVLPPA